MNAVELKPIHLFFEPKLLAEIERVGFIKKVEKGDILIDIGEDIKYIPLIIEGAIKVVREDEKGDELLLYFVEFGNTCAMTLNCCLKKTESEIRAICETKTKLIMIPVSHMDDFLANYKSWRTYIFENFHNRLTELLKAIDSLTFLNLEQRLDRYLKEKTKLTKNLTLEITHQEIAKELNSSRVVISRLLKKKEKEGTLLLGRNSIQLQT
ncbi:MAG: CRP/FNR family transcriptional regulator [Flavobacteriaceae bacterium]|jgi:CRP/FNR family transcriptional regulator|tara:strand:+ start:3614 stop:4243 length:630 start_codon:yes stop_codon:yes gene_type:complete